MRHSICLVVILAISFSVAIIAKKKPVAVKSIVTTIEPRSSAKQQQEPKCKKTLWMMGIGSDHKNVHDEYTRFTVASLYSVRNNAPSLIPIVLYNKYLTDIPPLLRTIPDVLFVSHNLSFDKNLHDYGMHVSYGTYFRLAIPEVMKELAPKFNPEEVDLEYVLYTDTDVLFMKDFNSCSLSPPRTIYIGPESERGTMTNSGVLYMNITSMRSHIQPLVQFADSRRWKFNANDQGLILEYFSGIAQLLPDQFNWKGYWGPHANVVLTHFHGPKPGRCLDCFLTFRLSKDRSVCHCPQYEYYMNLAFKVDNGAMFEEMLFLFTNYTEAHHRNGVHRL